MRYVLIGAAMIAAAGAALFAVAVAPAAAQQPTPEQGAQPRLGGEAWYRQQLIDLLNEDLAREYQAIIAYVNYSQVLKGAAYMTIAEELEAQLQRDREEARRFFST